MFILVVAVLHHSGSGMLVMTLCISWQEEENMEEEEVPTSDAEVAWLGVKFVFLFSCQYYL